MTFSKPGCYALFKFKVSQKVSYNFIIYLQSLLIYMVNVSFDCIKQKARKGKEKELYLALVETSGAYHFPIPYKYQSNKLCKQNHLVMYEVLNELDNLLKAYLRNLSVEQYARKRNHLFEISLYKECIRGFADYGPWR